MNDDLKDFIRDELEYTFELDEGIWCYPRSDRSGRDFYTNVPLDYLSDDEIEKIKEDVFEDAELEYSDVDWEEFEDIFDDVFWGMADSKTESIRVTKNKLYLSEDYEDEITEIGQEFTSANTSINSTKVPAVFKMVSFEPGTVNLDFGGGKFDTAADYLSDYDVINLVYDPYNRSDKHNKEVIATLKEHGGADTATCSNVLNVIKEPEVRINVLNNIKKLLKPNGTCYITVYEGTGKGDEGETKSGYQLNRKTADYLDEVKEVFPNAIRKGKLIVAKA